MWLCTWPPCNQQESGIICAPQLPGVPESALWHCTAWQTGMNLPLDESALVGRGGTVLRFRTGAGLTKMLPQVIAFAQAQLVQNWAVLNCSLNKILPDRRHTIVNWVSIMILEEHMSYFKINFRITDLILHQIRYDSCPRNRAPANGRSPILMPALLVYPHETGFGHAQSCHKQDWFGTPGPLDCQLIPAPYPNSIWA